MVNCSVSGCKRRSSTSNMRNNGVSYHMFPKDPLWREQWTRFCKNNRGWKSTRSSVICSDHFANSCWVPLSNKRRKLIDGAIPTVYSIFGDTDNHCMDPEIDENNSNKIILGPGQTPTASQIEKLLNVHPEIRKLKQNLELKNRKIKRLQSKILYMKNKLMYTEELLEKFKIDSLKYRQIRLNLKKKHFDRKKLSRNQMIPSVKRVMTIKRALFNV